MLEALLVLVGLLVGGIIGGYIVGLKCAKWFSDYVSNHQGERISHQHVLDVLAETQKENGEFIEVNKMKEYIKEHDGEEISLADVIEDDV